MDRKRGKVYLVGAGPGDPRLITVRGEECLKEADVVIYDYLAPEALLSLCRGETIKIFVGKRSEGTRLTQEEINGLLIHHAREGKSVTRLKGGDPFIFGRGGEESETLADAGIPFEIVPGVTAAIAVPSYAGIPLTHRDWTSSIAFITGHEDPNKPNAQLAWDKIATGIGTLIFYMGVRNLRYIVEQLVAHGRSSHTPIALVQWGTRPLQRTIVGTLENIVNRAQEASLEPPVTIVVGEVVRLRDKLGWYERLPLFGRRILVTRAEEQANAFAKTLTTLGGEVFFAPTIAVVPPSSWEPLDKAIDEIDRYDWLLLTSVNGVRYFFERLFYRHRDVRALAGMKICAIGTKTAEAMSGFGLRADRIPAAFTAEGILETFSGEAVAGKQFLLPRAKVAREVLPEGLRRKGGEVNVVPVYETVRPEGDIDKIRNLLEKKAIDMVTFTSSSTVNNFAELLGREVLSEQLDGVAIAAIGPVTAKTIRGMGLRCDVIPEKHTIEGLTETMLRYFQEHPTVEQPES